MTHQFKEPNRLEEIKELGKSFIKAVKTYLFNLARNNNFKNLLSIHDWSKLIKCECFLLRHLCVNYKFNCVANLLYNIREQNNLSDDTEIYNMFLSRFSELGVRLTNNFIDLRYLIDVKIIQEVINILHNMFNPNDLPYTLD